VSVYNTGPRKRKRFVVCVRFQKQKLLLIHEGRPHVATV